MRPIPIQAEETTAERLAQYPAVSAVVMSAPNGDLLDDDIRPVEAIRYMGELGLTYEITVQCEGDDLDKLNANGGKIRLTMVGAVIPFDLEAI